MTQLIMVSSSPSALEGARLERIGSGDDLLRRVAEAHGFSTAECRMVVDELGHAPCLYQRMTALRCVSTSA
ncbi:MAG: hypothetical protein M3Y87_03615 [Myxococcota bacterium]|nr:hypothetical protein [Myxococcota bacterium]